MVWILQMRRGFIRLQATFRARKVRRKYVRTRRRIMGFQVHCEECHPFIVHHGLKFSLLFWQRYCQGWIVRKSCRRKIQAAIKIQSLFRMVIAKKRFRKLKIEVCNNICWRQLSVYIHVCIFTYGWDEYWMCHTSIMGWLCVYFTLIPDRGREKGGDYLYNDNVHVL